MCEGQGEVLASEMERDRNELNWVSGRLRPSEREGRPLPAHGVVPWWVVRADMPRNVAYALCEAIELRKKAIPTDNFRPLSMAQLCANDEEAPFDVPLHPGAKQFYRDRGYLK